MWTLLLPLPIARLPIAPIAPTAPTATSHLLQGISLTVEQFESFRKLIPEIEDAVAAIKK